MSGLTNESSSQRQFDELRRDTVNNPREDVRHVRLEMTTPRIHRQIAPSCPSAPGTSTSNRYSRTHRSLAWSISQRVPTAHIW